MSLENPTAGEGPVLLDIGGDVGALIVTMPEHTRGLEVEIRPAGATAAGRSSGGVHAHDHPHDGAHGHHHANHDHGDGGHGHDHGPAGHTHASPYPHVGVVERRTPDGTHLSLVYPSVVEGRYELCPIPGDEVVLEATVVGGRVTEASWPG